MVDKTNEAWDALPAAIGRGAKRLGLGLGMAMGMKSLDKTVELRNAISSLLDDYLGFGKQQGWKGRDYTLTTFFGYLKAKYDYIPDSVAATQLADWADRNLKENFEEAANKILENEFISSAWKLIENEDPTKAQIDDLNKAIADGHLDIIKRSVEGNNKIPSSDVRKVGGPQRLISLVQTYINQNKDNTPTVEFDDTPETYESQWERMLSMIPGRHRALGRIKLDQIAKIVARDMLARGMFSYADETGKKTTSAVSNRNFNSSATTSNALSTSGSMVSMPVFLNLIKTSNISLRNLKYMESKANNNKDLGELGLEIMDEFGSKSLTIIACFAMAFRLKKEQRQPNDDYKDSNGRFVSCRDMEKLLIRAGVNAETMRTLNEIGESSSSISDVSAKIKSELNEATIRNIIACLALSLRVMTDEERNESA